MQHLADAYQHIALSQAEAALFRQDCISLKVRGARWRPLGDSCPEVLRGLMQADCGGRSSAKGGTPPILSLAQ
eukprot:SM000179S03404  [mRNA]  locus=s179:289322:289901:+ [translate_table: standard]